MRVTRLVVRDFGRIRETQLDLGRGLNVIYGPNDLGKSTLGTAIRAALLLPVTSSHAEAWVPWDRDARPHVQLTLQIEEGRLWRITKTFARDARGTSLLESSADGHTFTVEARGREVDQRLRDELGWGIARPGGKGGTRGMPESFLAKALLGEQAETDAILARGLGGDGTEEGRAQLTDALDAFAQDPVFKAILDAAQQEVEKAFTATGKPKRGKAAPRTPLVDARKTAKVALEEAERAWKAAEAVEQELGAARSRWQAAETARRDAAEAKKAAEARAAARTAYDAALAAYEQATAALAAFDADAQALARSHDELEAAERKSEAMRADVARAQATLETATEAAEAAKEAQRRASEEGGAQRAEERAAIEAGRSTLRARRGEAEGVRRAALRLAEAGQRRDDAREAHREVTEASRAAAETRAAADEALREADERLAELGVLADRARLAALEMRLRTAAEERARADDDDARATAKEAEAAALGTTPPELPDAAGLDALAALERARAVALGRLDVGLSARWRPGAGVRVALELDGEGQPANTTAASARRALRLVATSDAGETLLEVAVTGGDSEARAAAEAAEARFREASAAAFAALGVRDVAALREARRAADAREASGDALSQEARRLRAAAEAARARAARTDDDAREAARLRASLASAPAPSEEDAMRVAEPAALGEAERQAEARRKAARAALEAAPDASADLAASTAELASAEAELSRARDAFREARAPSDATVPAPALALDAAERAMQALDEELAALDARYAALEAEGQEALRTATAALQASHAQLSAAQKGREGAQQRHIAAQEAVASLRTRREMLAAALATRDRVVLAEAQRQAAEARDTAEAALRRLAHVEASVDAAEAGLRAAEAEEDAARSALGQLEGRLQQVGGGVARERWREAQEAHARAERALEEQALDEEAVKLLAETLKAAEQQTGQHLGEALAAPVGARFASLLARAAPEGPPGAAPRYGALRFGAALGEPEIEAAGQRQHTGVLSVGTREQLGALLRLVIAERLGTFLVLDDLLTQTDPARVAWFRGLLRELADDVQIIVLTCHPDDYLSGDDRPLPGEAVRERAAGLVRALDAEQLFGPG